MADCVEFSGSPEKWGDGVVGRRIGPVGAARPDRCCFRQDAALSKTRIGPVGAARPDRCCFRQDAALSKKWGDGFLGVVKVSEPLGISSTQGHIIKVQIFSPPAPPLPCSVLRNPVRTAFPLSQLEQKAVF